MKWVWLWAAGLIALAALYTAGLAHGRPRADYSPSTVQQARLNPSAIYHPDEFAYVGIPYQMLLENDWDPHYYHNPPLTIYINAGLFTLAGAEALPHNADYPVREIAPFALYVSARYLSALAALLTVPLTWAAGRAAFGGRAGIMAAVLVALSPLTVQHAHYATPNAQATLLLTAALLVALAIFTGRVSPRVPGWVIHLIAGLLVGLAMAGRYNAAVVGMVTGSAMLAAGWRERRWLPALVGFAAMPAGFVLGVPGIVLVTDSVIEEIREILEWYRVQGGGPGFSAARGAESFYYHWRYLLLIGIGPLAVVAACGGLASSLFPAKSRRAQPQQAGIALVLALYVVVYTGLALGGRRLQANLLFPLIAPLALLAGCGIARLWENTEWRHGLLVALVLVWPVALSLAFAYRVSLPDTRMRAQEWIYAHVPRGSSVYLLGPYNVPLDPLDYATSQTYAREASPLKVRESDAQIIVYSDAYPYVVLRDPAIASAKARTREEEIRHVLDAEWIVLARFKRLPWPGERLAPDDVSYWHQMEIVIYCHPARCPVVLPAGE